MAGRRVHFVMSEDLVARIDAALPGGVSRGEFVRRAVERALGDDLQRGGSDPLAVAESSAEERSRVRIPPPGRMVGGSSVGRASEVGDAPAEQPSWDSHEAHVAASREFARSSFQVKRDVAPIPKGKS